MFELYQLLFDSGRTQLPYQDFINKYGTEENKKVLYDKLYEAGDTKQSYDNFSLKYFSDYGIGPNDINITSTEPQTEFTAEEKKSGRLTYKQQQDLIHGREFTEPVYKKKPLTADQFQEFANAVDYSITNLNKKQSLSDLGIDIRQFQGLSIAEQLRNIEEEGKRADLNNFVIDNALDYIKQDSFLQDNNISEEDAREAIFQIATRKDYIGKRLQFDATQFERDQKDLLNGIQMTGEEYDNSLMQIYNSSSPENKRIMTLNRQLDALKLQLKSAPEGAAQALQNQINITEKELLSTTPTAWQNLSPEEKRNLSYADRQRLANTGVRASYTGVDGNPVNLSKEQIDSTADDLLAKVSYESPTLTVRESLAQEDLNLNKEYKLWNIQGKEMVSVPRSVANTSRGRGVLEQYGYNLKTDDSKSFEVPVRDLYNANLFLEGEAKAAVESYGIWKTNLDKKRIALNQLYHYNNSPEELENYKVINFGAAAIKASGVLGSQDKASVILKDNRTTLDIVKEFETQYNTINQKEIQGGNLSAISFNKDQEKAFERTMADNIVEGTGAFVPMIAEFAALEFVTGGAGTAIGLTNLMQKLRRGKSFIDKAKLAGILMAKEEVKTQLAGFKTGSGVAFSGVGQLIPNARIGFLSGAFNKLIKGGISGAVAGEVAGITEAAIAAVEGDENFQHFLDTNYRDLTGKEIAERLITNSAVFGLIGATHLKRSDISYKKYAEETLSYQFQRDFMTQQLEVAKDVNENKMSFNEAKEQYPWLTKEMTTAENIEQYENSLIDINNFLKAREHQQAFNPEDPNFESNVRKYVEGTFKDLKIDPDKKIKVKFVDSWKDLTDGGEKDNAKFVPKTNTLEFVRGQFSSGRLSHELVHAGLKAYYQTNPEGMRRFNDNLIKIIETAVPSELVEAVKKGYGYDLRKKLDRNLASEELMANIAEFIAGPLTNPISAALRLGTIENQSLLRDIKSSINNFAETRGLKFLQPDIKTGQDLVDFLGRFAYNVGAGKDVSKQIKRLGEIDLISSDALLKFVQEPMSAKDLITEKERGDIFSKAEKAYEQYIGDGPASAGLMVGMEFERIITKMADRIYRDVPGYQGERADIIKDVMMGSGPGYDGMIKLVETWKPDGGQKLTSYIYGLLPKRIIGIVNKHYPSLGKTRGFEEGESAKFTEEQGLGGTGAGFVDISSPELTTRIQAKKAETILGLKPESVKEFDRVAEMEVKFKFPDIEAKSIIEYNLGEKGNANVSYYENNTANVIINGKAEKIKARTPKDVEAYLNKKGFSIESQEKLGNFRQQKINSFRTQLYDVLQAEAGGTIEKGTKPSPEYSAFIDKAFPLYKDYFSQSSVNKRFADFKEPVIDKATGKQAREKTAQGNPIFTKKGITKAEWIKYFEGDGNIRIDGRRRALLETIAEEIGFDKIMEKVYDQSKQEQIKSRQAELGVELVENFAIILGKQLDRLPGQEIVFASKDITEAYNNLVGKNKSYTKEEFARVLVLASKVDSGYLKFEHPDIYNLLEQEVAERLGEAYNDVNRKNDINFANRVKQKGITDAILEAPGSLNKKQKENFENAIVELSKELPFYLLERTGGPRAVEKIGAFISSVLGFSSRNTLNTERFNKITENKFGENHNVFKEQNLEIKKAWDKFEQLTEEGTGRFKFTTKSIGDIKKIANIAEKSISLLEKQKEINEFIQTKKGKKLLKDIEASEAFLEAVLLTINKISSQQKNFKNNIAPLFRANDGLNFIRLFSPFKTIELKEGGFEKAKNEHLKAKAEFAADVYSEIYNGTLTPERLKQLKENWRSILGEEAAQKVADKALGKIYEGYTPLKLSFLGRKVVGEKGDFKLDVAIENLKNLYNFVEGKSEYDLLVNEIAKELVNTTEGLKLAEATNLIQDAISAEPIMSSKNITEEFDGMLERRSGLKGEISQARATQLGKGKGKFDLYIPPNAEDFAGLMYKLYGRGEQGTKDMEFVKETLLLPYERGENMISSYRQQISNKFKSFNQALKAFDNKFDKNAVKEIEDAGFTVDQALRVWIWNKNGYVIPDITLKEETKLVEIVRKNPKLLGTALQFRNMFGAGRPYPEPTGDWYASNVKFDAHRYINKGARKMFLEEFINNANEAFTPEFYSKAEAAFGKGYVKNLKEMLNAMTTGQSMPTNLPEYAVIGLNYINGAVGNIMFLNGRSSVLQTISMANFVNWTDNNILAVGKTLADPKNFAKTFMELMNSDFLKQRRDGLEISVEEAEIAKSLRESKNSLSHVWGKIIQLGYTPTKFADSFAIAAGGTPFYINRTKTYMQQGAGPVKELMVYNASPKSFAELGERSGLIYLATNPKEAKAYAEMNRGNVKKIFIDEAKIASEKDLLSIMKELGINTSEGLTYELIDPRFEDFYIGKDNMQKVTDALKEKGFKAARYEDGAQVISGKAESIVVFDKSAISDKKGTLKSGMSEAEAKKRAFDDFRMLAETHQQSSRQDKVSNVQRGLTGRLVYSFSGAPFQMAREQKKAGLNLINRRGSDVENISKFIYYGAMQNLLFTMLQQGIFAAAYEDDEVKFDKRTARVANSMLDATLRSSGLPGALLAMGKNAIIKYIEENEKGYQGDMGNVVGEALNLSPPVGSKFRNIYKGLQSRKFLLHTKKGRAEVEASNGFIENPLMHANARIIGGLTNYPVNRLMSKADNLTTAYTGLHRGAQAEPWQRFALAAGWDKWSLGFYDKKDDEGPKKTRSEIMKEIWAKKFREEFIRDSIKSTKAIITTPELELLRKKLKQK